MSGNMIFLNGRFIPAHEAVVSVFDRGFMYGDGVFETLRAYSGKVFALANHLKRLSAGCRAIGIKYRPDRAHMQMIISRLLGLNDLAGQDAYIRITLTRGVDSGGIRPGGEIKPTLLIIAKPINPEIEKYQKNGISAVILRDNPRCMPLIKSTNLLPNIIGLMEAKTRHAEEGIFIAGKKILEGAVTNIFIYNGRELKTPPLKDAVLPGITRQFVIMLAGKMGIRIRETSITINELMKCREAFLTNSLMEIVPLIKVERVAVGHGKIGAMTRSIQDSYRQLTRRQTRP